MSTRDYDTDFYAWTQAQVGALQAKDWAALDLEHVIEEIADLGHEQRHVLGRFSDQRTAIFQP